MKSDVPDIIKEVGFDFDWDNRKVWALQLPISWLDVRELAWHFDIPFLDENGGSYNLTPREVMENPGAHEKEYYRTMEADTIHPIDIMENKGRLLILDGLHRLMKEYMAGKDKVAVRIIPKEMIPVIIKTTE